MTQEHRMVGIGRDLRRSSSLVPLLQQDQLGLVAQYTVVRLWVSPQLETSQPLLSNLLQCSITFTVNALLCSDGALHVSVCPHCLCPVSGNMQPEPDERSVSSHCEFWIHGSLHGHSNSLMKQSLWKELYSFLHFSLLLSSILSSLSGNPRVDICKYDNLNILKWMEEVNRGCGMVFPWYSGGKDATWDICASVRFSSAVHEK